MQLEIDIDTIIDYDQIRTAIEEWIQEHLVIKINQFNIGSVR